MTVNAVRYTANVLQNHVSGGNVEYKDLLLSGASSVEIADHVVGGGTTAITIRIPKNLRAAAKEAAAMRGMSLSAFMRTCLIKELTEEARRGE